MKSFTNEVTIYKPLPRTRAKSREELSIQKDAKMKRATTSNDAAGKSKRFKEEIGSVPSNGCDYVSHLVSGGELLLLFYFEEVVGTSVFRKHPDVDQQFCPQLNGVSLSNNGK